METTAKLVQALVKLLEDKRFKKPDSDEIDPTKITYVAAIEAFTKSGITEEDVLSDIRSLALAEISFGVATILNGGGPVNPGNTLRYEGIAAILKLWRETVACQADLEEEQRRERERLREGVAGTQEEGQNAQSENVDGDKGFDADRGDD